LFVSELTFYNAQLDISLINKTKKKQKKSAIVDKPPVAFVQTVYMTVKWS